MKKIGCNHSDVSCINHYEFIRKYRCNNCGEIMMCSCDETFGRRFLPHQLNTATEPNTQRRIPVTLGFQDGICNSCRGLSEEAHPKTPRYGSTSKIVRYYWREIYSAKTTRFNDWAEQEGYTKEYLAKQEHPDVHKRIEREVTEKFKHSMRRTRNIPIMKSLKTMSSQKTMLKLYGSTECMRNRKNGKQ